MDIAPGPSRRRDSAHDGMLGLMEVFGRVLAGRGIAAADVAARLTLAKSNPNGPLNETFLAGGGRSVRRKILRH
jgi:hypothetical protein